MYPTFCILDHINTCTNTCTCTLFIQRYLICLYYIYNIKLKILCNPLIPVQKTAVHVSTIAKQGSEEPLVNNVEIMGYKKNHYKVLER